MDYNNILCEAISTIVDQRISEVSFDSTIICTIVDDTKKLLGEYIVASSKQVEFKAYSENTTYKLNDQVCVLIPKNEDEQKTILRRYSVKNDDKPIAYVDPEERIFHASDNLFSKDDNGMITANGQQTKILIADSVLPLKSINSLMYSKIMFSANFNCLLQNYNIIKGSYGLQIVLLNQGNIINDFIFSNSDMFGDSYKFVIESQQKKIFDISNLQYKIDEIQLYLYQNNDFIKDNNEKLPIATDEKGQEIPNIKVKNIKLYFCDDVKDIPDNTFRIFCNNLNYNTVDNIRSLSAVWYNKDENNKGIGYTDSEDYVILWQHLKNGYWENFSENELKDLDLNNYPKNQNVEIILNLNAKYENIRAILLCENTEYHSENLAFYNTDIKDPTLDSSATIDIALGTGAQYSYIYDDNTKRIINPEHYDKRILKLLYYPLQTNVNEEKFFNNAEIQWMVPKEDTMVSCDIDTLKKDFEFQENENYFIFISKNGIMTKPLIKTFCFNIKSMYKITGNNFIICKVIYNNDVTYVKKIYFSFSPKGNSGTEYTLDIIPVDTDRVIAVKEKNSNNIKPITVKAVLTSPDGVPISLDDTYNVSWKWRDKSITPLVNGLVVLDPGSVDSYLKQYNVLEVSIRVLNTAKNKLEYPVTITKQLSIPYTISDKYYTSLIPEIIYDSKGTYPNYSKNLNLYNENGNNISDTVVWNIIYHPDFDKYIKEQDKEIIKSYLPKIGISENNKSILLAPPMFIKTDKQISVQATISNKIVWQSPIIIKQNRYGSEILNNWGGDLILDEKGNRILSAMIGAGVKNDNNTFSGVLMGDTVNVVANGDSAERRVKRTGLFGYHEGEQSFGLNIDGTSFLGKSGCGRIEFDGNKGVIRSGNYTKTTGMKIDLSEGHIDAYNFSLSSEKCQINSNGSFKFGYGDNYISSNGNNMQLRSTDFKLNAGYINIQPTLFSLQINQSNSLVCDYNGVAIASKHFTLSSDNCSMSSNGDFRFGNSYSYISGSSSGIEIAATNFALTSDDLKLYSYDHSTVSVNNNSTNTWRILAGINGNYKFGVTSAGQLYAADANLSGTIHANQGNIGGWEITEDGKMIGGTPNLTTEFCPPSSNSDYVLLTGAKSAGEGAHYKHCPFGIRKNGTLEIGNSDDPRGWFTVYEDGHFWSSAENSHYYGHVCGTIDPNVKIQISQVIGLEERLNSK